MDKDLRSYSLLPPSPVRLQLDLRNSLPGEFPQLMLPHRKGARSWTSAVHSRDVQSFEAPMRSSSDQHFQETAGSFHESPGLGSASGCSQPSAMARRSPFLRPA